MLWLQGGHPQDKLPGPAVEDHCQSRLGEVLLGPQERQLCGTGCFVGKKESPDVQEHSHPETLCGERSRVISTSQPLSSFFIVCAPFPVTTPNAVSKETGPL